MKKKQPLLLIFLFFALLLSLPVSANAVGAAQPGSPVRDSLSVSLLTCSPGPAVYELYGHTALRVRGAGADDWVFNYGTFSFRRPHFVWRFMLGRTDYELSVVPYTYFYAVYAREGRGITEQRLNLTPAEAKRLADALGKNLLPENATYRYNFFYDNCTTRAVDAVTAALDGTVRWPKAVEGKTLRGIVRQYSAASPWNKFGQDLLLGAEADAPADMRRQLFAPLYAQRFVASAVICGSDGRTRSLAAPVSTLLPPVPAADGGFPVSPLAVFLTLFLVVAALTAWEWRKGRNLWGLDSLLLLSQGLAGCVISFLFFFSAHPAVGSNWLVTMFNPLPLLYLPWFMKRASLRLPVRGMYVQAVLLLVCLVAGLAGLQSYPPELYLALAALALRCAVALRRTPLLYKESR